MNEVGGERVPVRQGPGYEGFARRIYREIRGTDPTRPVIENDWMEPDPDYVFESPILTAHWYGRLSPRYVAELETRLATWARGERPLLMSEFGDWGLPDLEVDEGAFWSYRDQLVRLIASAQWPASTADFVLGTQRYQGLADRFQVELFRRSAGVIGWCVTELTDVPQEFNGLLDLRRQPKGPAYDELRRARRRHDRRFGSQVRARSVGHRRRPPERRSRGDRQRLARGRWQGPSPRAERQRRCRYPLSVAPG